MPRVSTSRTVGPIRVHEVRAHVEQFENNYRTVIPVTDETTKTCGNLENRRTHAAARMNIIIIVTQSA